MQKVSLCHLNGDLRIGGLNIHRELFLVFIIFLQQIWISNHFLIFYRFIQNVFNYHENCLGNQLLDISAKENGLSTYEKYFGYTYSVVSYENKSKYEIHVKYLYIRLLFRPRQKGATNTVIAKHLIGSPCVAETIIITVNQLNLLNVALSL